MRHMLLSEDVSEIVRTYGHDKVMSLMIDKLRKGFEDLGHGDIQNSPRRFGFTREGDLPGVIEIMPHREPKEFVAVKVVSYSPENLATMSIPTVLGITCLVDDDTGQILAIADARLLTAMRTAAASAIATEKLGNTGDGIVGIVGAGAQAVTQLHALSKVAKINEVLIYDTNRKHALSYIDRISFLETKCRISSASEIMRKADIICTATSVRVGDGPVVPDEVTKPWLHINAVGSDEHGKTELPVEFLHRARIIPDHIEQALYEGESQQVGRSGLFCSLSEICVDDSLARECRDLITVFDSTGFALEDKFAMEVIVDLASNLHIGVVENKLEDVNPLDPYHGIWRT